MIARERNSQHDSSTASDNSTVTLFSDCGSVKHRYFDARNHGHSATLLCFCGDAVQLHNSRASWTMPNAAKLWQSALKQLQQFPKDGQEAGSGADTPYVLPSSREFTTSPKANSAVWKQLIKELKVTACLLSWLHGNCAPCRQSSANNLLQLAAARPKSLYFNSQACWYSMVPNPQRRDKGVSCATHRCSA